MSPQSDLPDDPARPAPLRWVLRRADQAVVAALLAAGLVSMAAYALWHRARGERLIEIDRAAPRTAAYRVDINRAEWPELANLPEIGETLARRIVESRAREGPFHDVRDLERVDGIGPRTRERLAPFVLPIPPRGTVAGP